jgi:hypothetical protein
MLNTNTRPHRILSMPEILRSIFAEASKDRISTSIAPLIIAHTCRDWRAIAHGCRSLWTKLTLVNNPCILSVGNIEAVEKQLESWTQLVRMHLYHSGKATIEFKINFSLFPMPPDEGNGVEDEDRVARLHDKAGAILGMLNAARHRWRHMDLDLHGVEVHSDDLMDFTQLPNLTHLFVGPAQAAFTTLPCTEMCINDNIPLFRVRCTSQIGGIPQAPNLTWLEISMYQNTNSAHKDLVFLLQHCINLETLKVDILEYQYSTEDLLEGIVAKLNHLRNLSVHYCAFGDEPLLTRIIAPALQQLSISHDEIDEDNFLTDELADFLEGSSDPPITEFVFRDGPRMTTSLGSVLEHMPVLRELRLENLEVAEGFWGALISEYEDGHGGKSMVCPYLRTVVNVVSGPWKKRLRVEEFLSTMATRYRLGYPTEVQFEVEEKQLRKNDELAAYTTGMVLKLYPYANTPL